MGGVAYFTDSKREGEGSKGMYGIQCVMDIGGECISRLRIGGAQASIHV